MGLHILETSLPELLRHDLSMWESLDGVDQPVVRGHLAVDLLALIVLATDLLYTVLHIEVVEIADETVVGGRHLRDYDLSPVVQDTIHLVYGLLDVVDVPQHVSGGD